MKKNLQWSILLWSVFFSMFIITSFLFIINSFSSSIKTAKDFNKIDLNNEIISQTPLSYSWEIDLWENKKLDIFFDKNVSFSYNMSIKEKQTLDILASWTWDIHTSSWYIYIKNYSWSTVYLSWYYFENTAYPQQYFQTWKLDIINLWWNTNYFLNTSIDSNLYIKYPYNYKIIKQDIWWKEFIRNQIFITE